MDRRTSPSASSDSGTDLPEHRPSQNPRTGSPAPGGKVLALGAAFVRTVRHVCPLLDRWLDSLPDSRFQPFVVYDKRFLFWWGLLLFVCKLGSRRQLDYELRDLETQVLDNVNRLAGTEQQTLPVHKTLDHFLGHVGAAGVAAVRSQCIQRLLRMRVLDAGRLQGKPVAALDGSGFLVFGQRHCPYCLTMKTQAGTVYLHPVWECKLVDPRGLALSIGTEFIENPLPVEASATEGASSVADYDEKNKQDCELKGWSRLAAELKAQFAHTPWCISGDSLYACGPAIAICQQHGWSFVFTFKEGRTPALWADFQGLLELSPENRLRMRLADGTEQRYRWVNELDYRDSDGRAHCLNAVLCEETRAGETTTYAWITDLRVNAHTVIDIAEKGGRIRSKIENEGFNLQKNSGLNLEHAYSFGTEQMQCFYLLLQLAHLFLQLFEKGSLLRRLASEYGGGVAKVFGSLKNLGRRLLECLRYFSLPSEAFDPTAAAGCQIRLDDS